METLGELLTTEALTSIPTSNDNVNDNNSTPVTRSSIPAPVEATNLQSITLALPASYDLSSVGSEVNHGPASSPSPTSKGTKTSHDKATTRMLTDLALLQAREEAREQELAEWLENPPVLVLPIDDKFIPVQRSTVKVCMYICRNNPPDY